MTYDVMIIGGGIVGLATARQLLVKRPALKVAILEKESQIAQHQSSHNSGVLHSGVYYRPGSLRATNCIRGYRMMTAFCEKEKIPYEICGKVIVATEKQQLPTLEGVYQRGLANGLKGLKKLGPEAIREHEPHVRGLQAIFVPQAGIADFPAVCRRLAEQVKEKGGEIHTGQEVQDIRKTSRQVEVVTGDKTFAGRKLVNCAGLYADKIARLTRPETDLQILPFRGEYYKIKAARKHLVNHLVYPAPDPNFPWLGVHFTRMIGGAREAGPNAVLAFSREGYRFGDLRWGELRETLAFPGFRKMALRYWKVGLHEYYRSRSKKAFARALQKLIPEIQADDLEPGGAGVRALACDKNGNLIDDYVIYTDKQVINLCNAPSPAATSALSIGETVAGKVLE